MSRTAAVRAVVVLLVVAVGVVLLYALVAGDGDRTAGDAELEGDGAALIDLLARREAATYHAVYSGSDPAGQEGADVTLEVWRAGDQVRTDTRAGSGDQAAETTTIATSVEAIACNRTGDDAWVCAPSEQALDDGFGGLAARLAGVVVTETDDTDVGGRPARCFDFASAEGPGQVCTTPDGVILRLAVGPTVLELTALDDDVSADDFVPPAPVG